MDGITNEVVYFSATQKETNCIFFFYRLCNHRIETWGSKISSWFPDLSPMTVRADLFETEPRTLIKIAHRIPFCLPWASRFTFLPGYSWALRASVAPQLWFKAGRQKVLLHCLLQAMLPRAESYGHVNLEQFASETLCYRKIVAAAIKNTSFFCPMHVNALETVCLRSLPTYQTHVPSEHLLRFNYIQETDLDALHMSFI